MAQLQGFIKANMPMDNKALIIRHARGFGFAGLSKLPDYQGFFKRTWLMEGKEINNGVFLKTSMYYNSFWEIKSYKVQWESIQNKMTASVQQCLQHVFTTMSAIQQCHTTMSRVAKTLSRQLSRLFPTCSRTLPNELPIYTEVLDHRVCRIIECRIIKVLLYIAFFIY